MRLAESTSPRLMPVGTHGLPRLLSGLLSSAAFNSSAGASLAPVLAVLVCWFGLNAASAASVTLAWDPNPEPDVAGYRLYYGAPVGNFNTVVECGNVTNRTVEGLHPGRRYGFYVTCYNTLGLESDPSNLVEYLVPGVDSPPSGEDQNLDVFEGELGEIELQGSDADGDPLTFTVVSGPVNGILTGEAPTLKYRAPIGYNGRDAFKFVVSDGYTQSAEVAFTIQVKSPPNAIRLKSGMAEDGVTTFKLPATDATGAPLSYSQALPPLHGSLEGTPSLYIYRPYTNFNGGDDIVLTATNSQKAVTTVLVKVTVRPVNDRPTAESQEISLDADFALPIWLTGSDVDADELSFQILKLPVNGTLSGKSPEMTYVPNAGFVGQDAIIFQVSDASTNSLPATVTLHVEAVNRPPRVDAGPDQVVTLPSYALLRGTLTDDDGTGQISQPGATWNQMLGPAAAVIADPFSPTTRVFFTEPGAYGFELVGYDGELDSSDAVFVQVNALGPTSTNQPPFVLYLEAEDGKITPPMAIFTNATEGPFAPAYVSTSAEVSGTLALSFEVPEEADYIVWCRTLRSGPTNDSFFVTLDSEPLTEDIGDLGEPGLGEDWTWRLLAGRGGADRGEAYAYSLNPRVFHLSAGAHLLTFRGREVDTRLDAIAITSDAGFDPRVAEGHAEPPQLSFAVAIDGALELTWTSVPGRRYVIAYKDDLAGPAWAPIGPAVRANSSVTTRTVPVSAQRAQRLYSVVSLP